MGDLDSKHDKYLNRIHLWVAILVGIVTLVISLYNMKHMFFSEPAVSKPALEAGAGVNTPVVSDAIPVVSSASKLPSFEIFKPMDRDDDGKVSVIEWKGPREDFDLLDLDGNGTLNSLDFKAARFEDMDRNGDGVIPRIEWRKTRHAFDLLDANADGKISADEYNARWKG